MLTDWIGKSSVIEFTAAKAYADKLKLLVSKTFHIGHRLETSRQSPDWRIQSRTFQIFMGDKICLTYGVNQNPNIPARAWKNPRPWPCRR